MGIGPVSAPNSSVTATPDRAAIGGQIALGVVVRDEFNRVIPNATIRVSSDNANLTLDTTSGTTDANGTFTAHVTSAVATTGSVQVNANGTPIGSATAQFQEVGQVSAANSSVSVMPDRAAADGQATITLTVIVRDDFNLLFPTPVSA